MKLLSAVLMMVGVTTMACGDQVSPEAPPTVPAAQLLPAAVLSGTDYGIGPQVQTDGFLGVFDLYTRFGDYECEGREMLYLRLRELAALEQIDRVSKTRAFASAITKGAIGEPVDAVVHIARSPVASLEQAPLGAAHLVGEVLGGFVSAGKEVGKVAGVGKTERTPGATNPPPSREDPIGYNSARNEWAAKFGVDPYTTNRPLALRLNHLGMISFSMDKISGASAGWIEGGFGPIADYLTYLPDVDEHLLTKPPRDIYKYNLERLGKLGASKQRAEVLLLVGNLVLQDGESCFTSGRDEHAFATGEVVADDIGDGVCLASPWRPLNRYTGSSPQPLHDGHLLVVIRQGEIQLLEFATRSRCSTSRQPTERDRLKFDRLIGRLRHECERAFMDRAAPFELLLQTFEILEEIVDGPWSREQYPGVRYDEVRARRRSRAILVQNFLVLPLAV